MWDSTEVEVWSSTSRDHVLWCHGRFLKTGKKFYLVNVYAPFALDAKQTLWDSLLGMIHVLNGEKVCVCGDFNAVRSIEERHSSKDVPNSSDLIPFNQFIDDAVLIDLPLSGHKFTWYKGDGLAMSRLDRFMLSEEWCLTWPNCIQVTQLRGLSDYYPLVLEANEENWGPRSSRMLKCWKDIPSYQQFVRDKWPALHFDGWGGGEEDALTAAEIEELHEITSDIHFLSRRSASICWQQSRSLWLKEGDANSKYFHSVIASRKRGNAISSIQVDGVATERVQTIRQAVLAHFASHFKARNVDRLGVENLHFRWLTMMERGSLIKPFSLEEVKLLAELQGDIMRFIAEFHRNGKLTKGLNSTFIALIPKVDSPNILDGILIANEAVDEARRTKKELILFKVDFEKAYHSVDWGYLDAVMGRMSFPISRRKWMKKCICTASASVLVNGSPTEEFPLERGLRQGDPLSPFLFLLAAEGLNVLMQAMVEHHFFSGYSFGMQNPISISHLQFADDTLLLGTKCWANVHALRAALVLFETMSGLKVNFNKSMLVGVNIADSWLRVAASALRCKVGQVPFIYLGLPIGGDPRRLGFWEPVLTHIQNRLSGWKSRFLSFGGRLVLLKSMLTSLLVYALSFFKAPSGKWCWRMLVDREGLWFRVLAARYGVERGCVREGGGVAVWAFIGLGDEQVEYDGKDVFFRVGHWRGGMGVEEAVVGGGGGDVGGVSGSLSVVDFPTVLSSGHCNRSYLAQTAFLVLFRHQLGHGLACLRWIRKIWLITSFSILSHMVVLERAVLFFSFIQFTFLFVWVIWNERNHRLFRNLEQSLPQLLDKVKLYSYWWLKTTISNLVSNYHNWWTSPLTCLDIV
ncbi:hypothetical protein TSUD_146720 [Trifolium subterraneum]|uniref:Reverse transcriptase domain-containing protein n=1 Tax=Trifolium subterraneum TaxID=3900 RepID=A0A2Z6M6E0_TRISU|nr:hypothetical protein TSUD_146720 [Trifolium subterraneum]